MHYKAEQAIAVVTMLIGIAILSYHAMTKQLTAVTSTGVVLVLVGIIIFTTNMTIKDQNEKRRDKWQ